MYHYGTNPGLGMKITGVVPDGSDLEGNDRKSFDKSLNYMGIQAGKPMLGMPVDYVFVGSCTNGRIEDFRMFASLVRGRKKAEGVTAWLVPGSKRVEKQAVAEGLTDILREAGFEFRQPGCSALA
jgi:3-isopropylmalate/(R)-2-methylmalate dehydratase large subunit